jgi:uncharacterized protein
MHVSKYNIEHKLPDGRHILFNPLSGALDLANSTTLKALLAVKAGKGIDQNLVERLLARGYLYETEAQEAAALMKLRRTFRRLYNVKQRFVLIPNYTCNLRCTYCFEAERLRAESQLISQKVLRAAFAAIGKLQRTDGPTVTLYGGEPLLARQQQKDIIKQVITEAADRGWRLTITSNGTELEGYCDILDDIEHVQVTLDGPADVHDSRRIFADGSGSFWKIVRGVDAARAAGIRVIIRVNVDAGNIGSLPELADFISDHWHGIFCYLAPVKKFLSAKCAGCLPESDILMRIARLYKTHPKMRVLTLGGWQGLDTLMSLVRIGSLHPPQFVNCEGNINLHVLDLHGDIYPCSAVCGMRQYVVGNFWPRLRLNRAKLKLWRGRSIFSIPKCRDCRWALLCGGGCAILAAADGKGFFGHYCKPIERALRIGFEVYAEDLLNMTR